MSKNICFCNCIHFFILCLFFLFCHLTFFCLLSPGAWSSFKGALKDSKWDIFFLDKNRKWVNLSRAGSSQILCLVSGGMCGWNTIVLQSRVCSYVRCWCHLHTGGKFDCPRCLELFRFPCLNKTLTKAGSHLHLALFYMCLQSSHYPTPPLSLQKKAASLCKLTVYCLFFLLESPQWRACAERRKSIWSDCSHCALPCKTNIPVKPWEPIVYLHFVAFSFQCGWDGQTPTCWRLVVIRHVMKGKIIVLIQADY